MIIRFIKSLVSKLRFRGRCVIGLMTIVTKDSEFEGMCQIYKNSFFHGKMGMGSYISEECVLSANIGRFTSIANSVTCNPGHHPYKEPFVSSSPCFFH